MWNYECHKKYYFCGKIAIMGANSSYTMCDIVEQAKEGTIFIPDDFTACGTPDVVRSGLTF